MKNFGKEYTALVHELVDAMAGVEVIFLCYKRPSYDKNKLFLKKFAPEGTVFEEFTNEDPEASVLTLRFPSGGWLKLKIVKDIKGAMKDGKDG